jgi:hypothetical protein
MGPDAFRPYGVEARFCGGQLRTMARPGAAGPVTPVAATATTARTCRR